MTIEETILHHMKNLDITRAEAIQLIEDDRRIDKGEKLFNLSEEQEKEAKKARQADRKPTVYNFTKRERKENNEKRQLISLLVETLVAESAENIEISNVEREFTFVFNQTKYKIVLSCPRS